MLAINCRLQSTELTCFNFTAIMNTVLLVVFGIALVTGQDDDWSTCPSGWQSWEGYCYYFIGYSYIWGTADSYCQSLAGTNYTSHLVSIHSLEENQFVNSLTSYDVWIGLHRNSSTGYWQWSDGTALDYYNWESGFPGTSSQCAYFRKAVSSWRDYVCSYTFYGVCKARHLYAETTASPSTTPIPTADCTDLVGIWRSTLPGSWAKILILTQDSSGEFVKLQGMFQNTTEEGYYPMDGWTGHGMPSVIMLNVMFQAGLAARSLNGVCLPSSCPNATVIVSTLQMQTSNSRLATDETECDMPLAESYSESFELDVIMMAQCGDQEMINDSETLQIYCSRARPHSSLHL